MFQAGKPQVLVHSHDGVNSQRILESSIIPTTGAMGKILFIRNATYTLNFSSKNPSLILFNGFALNNTVPASAAVYAYITGNAVLSSCYYFQPDTTSSVKIGGTKCPIDGVFAQCSSCLLIDSTILGNATPHVDQFNIIAASTGSGLVAKGTIQNLTLTSVQLQVTLTAGWSILGNFTIL